VLETDRLVLRHLTLNDAPFIVELLTQPSFLRFIGDRGVKDKQTARSYLLKGPIASYEKFGFGLNLVFLRESGDAIGICGLLKRDALEDVDLGFAFLPAHWRRGYARESASAMLAHGRDVHGLLRIVAITSPDNAASIGVLEKIGLEFEALTRLGGDPREVRLYAIHF
jgi:RimJ/RimL family protein N-acetyltransferase